MKDDWEQSVKNRLLLMELQNTIFLSELAILSRIQASGATKIQCQDVNPVLNTINRGGKAVKQWIDANTGRWLSHDQIPKPDYEESDGNTSVKVWVGENAEKATEFYENLRPKSPAIPFLEDVKGKVSDGLDRLEEIISSGSESSVSTFRGLVDGAFATLEKAGKDAYIGEERETWMRALDGFKNIGKDFNAVKASFFSQASKVDEVAASVLGAAAFSAIAVASMVAGITFSLIEKTGEKIPHQDKIVADAALFAIASKSPFAGAEDYPQFNLSIKKISKVCKKGLAPEIQKALCEGDIEKMNRLIKRQAISVNDMRKLAKEQASLLKKEEVKREKDNQRTARNILAELARNPELHPANKKKLGQVILSYLKFQNAGSALEETENRIKQLESQKGNKAAELDLVQLGFKKNLLSLAAMGRYLRLGGAAVKLKMSPEDIEKDKQKLEEMQKKELAEILKKEVDLEEFSQTDLSKIYEQIEEWGWTLPVAGFLIWFAAKTKIEITPT
jgi:hypothetical protein